MTARDLKLANCFVGGGEMGALMRAKDWAATPLGPVERWPQSLRTIVSTMLASRIPMLVFWGRDYIQLYNDGYIPIFGADKHPHGLGVPARNSWAEVWDYVGARFDHVMASGETTSSDDQLFLLDRSGLIEECYFTFSYSPLRDESGAVGGVLSTCVETTRHVIGARRLETLRALAALPSQHDDVAGVAAAAVQALEANAHDFSFVALYLRDRTGSTHDLVPASGHVSHAGLLPARVDPESGATSPFVQAQRDGRLTLVREPDALVPQSPVGVWKLPVNAVTVLPLAAPGKEGGRGFLVAGLSPRLVFDDAYRTFVETTAASIVAALNHADAFEQEARRAHMLETNVAERTADLVKTNRALSAEVAERRRVELELRASEERFRQAFAHASVGVTIRDRAGRFVSANRAFCEMTGYAESELTVIDSQSLIHPEDRARNIAELRALVSGARPGYVIEKRYVRKDGEIIWVRSSVSLVHDNRGQPVNLVTILEDITGRKRAVDELRASEARFRRLTTLSSDWYWEQDSEFRMVFISQGIEKTTGIAAQLVLGKRRWETRTVGLSAQEWEAHKKLLLAHQPFHDLEFAVVRPDGEARWMQISGEPVFDNQHAFTGYQGVGRDITERRQAHLRLAESEARLQAFMSNSSSMMFIKDLQGRYLHANEAFARGLGSNVEAILHRIDDDLFPAEVAAGLRANDELAIARRAAIQIEEAVPFVNGVRTSIVSKFPLFDSDGNVVAVGGIATDITERKQVQRTLEDRERLLNGVLEALPVGVWITDAAGNIIHGNPAGRRIWGGERKVGIEEFGEYKAWWAGTDRRIAAHEWALARAVERGETSLNELVDIECFDGTRKTMLNSAVPLRDAEGEITGAIVVNEDVTARRQVEAAVASIAAGVSSAIGRDFFSLLAEQLCAALGADCAFIVEVDADHTGHTIAAFVGGRVVENFSYDVRGSPCEQVILQRTEVVANDACARFEQVPVLDKFGVRHYAGTPLLDSLRNRNVVGLMFVGSKQSFDNPELVRSALHILASRAAVELERKRNEEIIRALLKVGETLYGATGLDALVDAIVTESVRLVDASGGVIGLHAETGERMTRHFRDGALRDSDSRWRYEGGPAQWAVEHRTPCLIDDCAKDGRMGHAWTAQSGSRCLLCVPVLDGTGRPLGFIELHGRPERGTFAENDLEAVVGISRLAAIALQKEQALGQLQDAEAGLLRSEQQMRALATRLQTMLEEQRTRIAREIHDEMGQALTGLKLDLAWLKTRLGKLDADQGAQFQSLFKSIDAMVHSVRRIASDLRPGELDDLGLVAAIESLAQEFQERTKTRCRAYLPEADFDIDSDLATAVFRICQELLTNIMRHAHARLAEVRLARENGSLLLEVRDDGVGIRQPDVADQQSMGLAGVRERVKMFGGTVEFKGRPGAGTVVCVSIPLRSALPPKPNEAGVAPR